MQARCVVVREGGLNKGCKGGPKVSSTAEEHHPLFKGLALERTLLGVIVLHKSGLLQLLAISGSIGMCLSVQEKECDESFVG